MGVSARLSGRRFTEARRSLVVTAVTVAIAGLVPVVSNVTANALGTGTGINYTLEGCRASSAVYGANGPFVCPNADYTTGNLGSGWNELDVVPGRVTVAAGNSSPGTYAFLVSVDRCSDNSSPCTATPGYDRLSTLGLDNASTGTCGTATVGAETPFEDQLFRLVTISNQGANSNCIYNFYARLAFGSHGYPGASLHYHLKNDTHGTQGIGNRDISIPVKQIAPFVFKKTETATQGSSVVWSVNKNVTSSVSFNDTCASTDGQAVSVQVSWTKTVTGGDITVDGKITVGNNAHRPLGILVHDTLYAGSDQSSPDSTVKTADYSSSPYWPALTTSSYDDIWSPPDNQSVTTYNDIATATINDPAFGDTFNLPNATASANLTTTPPDSGATAVITDVEALTDGTNSNSVTPATDYKFRVTGVTGASGTIKTAANTTYTPGANATLTTGPLTWTSGSQSGSGSVTFSKEVVPSNATQESATLHDTATVTPDGQSASTSSASTAISADATVEIDISKTTTVPLDNDNTFTFNAYAPGQSPPNGTIAGSTTVTIPKGTIGPVVSDPGITGLEPGVAYYIDEPAVAPFPPNSASDVEVDLPDCSTEVPMENQNAPASAQVEKITDPLGATTWEFTLTGTKPNGGGAVDDLGDGTQTSEVLTGPTAVVANTGYAQFASALDIDGATYKIAETTQTNWDNTLIEGDLDGDAATTSTSTHTCTVTVDLSAHSGGLFECSFTNVEESNVTVVKTQNGGTPTFQFPFRLCTGSNMTTCGGTVAPAGSTTLKTNNGENPVGTLNFGYHAPGDFTLCELGVAPGFHSTLQDPPYNGTLDGNTGNVCYSFHLNAGDDREFDIDNISPKGNALTIGYWKHWNSINVGKSIGAGNKLMDAFLPLNLGPYVVDTAAKGVAVLSNPSMKYAENGLAAQLLAAELNVASNADTCVAITTAITHANQLLTTISYAGPVGNKVGNKFPTRADWVATASTLDQYNNNLLC